MPYRHPEPAALLEQTQSAITAGDWSAAQRLPQRAFRQLERVGETRAAELAADAHVQIQYAMRGNRWAAGHAQGKLTAALNDLYELTPERRAWLEEHADEIEAQWARRMPI